ncbi:MAG: hypothetical protein Q9225_005116 [Loekoesia sp. 1 TL-2023]
MASRSNKRRCLSKTAADDENDSDLDLFEVSATAWNSAAHSRASGEECKILSRSSISPPPTRDTIQKLPNPMPDGETRAATVSSISALSSSLAVNHDRTLCGRGSISSPFQLSTVNGLAASSNIDTVSLGDILGDPLVKECWLFNYIFDVDFIMSHLDEDTREMVQVNIVHGSWKKEDPNRVHIEEAAKKYKNIHVITAYLAEMYGTHHSKMIILFRHDEQAQVIIVTGNFIVRDWSMCQAIWRSPLLSLLTTSIGSPNDPSPPLIGSGVRFKKDLLAYLRAYGVKRTGSLTAELDRYDFSSIRAALIASVPGKQNLWNTDPETETIWGWPAFRHVFSCIKSTSAEVRPHIVMQCSSVASVGEKWMEDTFLKALSVMQSSNIPKSQNKPKFSLVFPTADEIRRSVDGYASGGSIHMKLQNSAQVRQLHYLRSMLCHWAGDQSPSSASADGEAKGPVRQALRRRAAPHIKTYIRFSDKEMTKIDWAIMTSANLSKQAWGEAATAGGEVKICSYEIGVVVWPGLWDEGEQAKMVPVFGKDMPDDGENDTVVKEDKEAEDEETTDEEGGKGLREWKVEEQRKSKIKSQIGWGETGSASVVDDQRFKSGHYPEKDKQPWKFSTDLVV